MQISKDQSVLSINPHFGKTTTKIKVVVHKVKVLAVLDTGSPVNVVSSKLTRNLNLAQDLTYSQSYGTARPASTKAIGAYSSLPMRFEKLVITAPDIVLKNDSYNLFIGTQLLREYEAITINKEGYLSLLGYQIPLVFDAPKKGKARKYILVIWNIPKEFIKFNIKPYKDVPDTYQKVA